MFNVVEILLNDCVDFIVDNRGKTPETTDQGFPLIEVNAISNNSVKPDYSVIRKFISDSVYHSWFRKGHPKKNDILIPTVGTIGGVALMDETEAAIAQNVIGLRIKPEVESKFIYYYLRSNSGRDQMLTLDIGGVQPSIKVPHLLQMVIPIPPLPEQQAIAEVLSSLDDKIDLLHRNNKTLEEMAETLFRHTSVHSVPINLGEIIEIFDNKRIPLSSIQRSQMKEGQLYPYYGAATIMDYVNDFIFDGDFLLMGEDGTVQDEEGYPVLQRLIGKAWVNNHTHVLRAVAPFTNDLLEVILKSTSVSHIVTGAVQPKINQASLKSLEILVPESGVMELAKQVEVLMQKRQANRIQIALLSETRDKLLPKLMSGQVKVNP